MSALNKKRKARNTLLDRGGEKGKFRKLKRERFYHKKDRKYFDKLMLGE